LHAKLNYFPPEANQSPSQKALMAQHKKSQSVNRGVTISSSITATKSKSADASAFEAALGSAQAGMDSGTVDPDDAFDTFSMNTTQIGLDKIYNRRLDDDDPDDTASKFGHNLDMERFSGNSTTVLPIPPIQNQEGSGVRVAKEHFGAPENLNTQTTDTNYEIYDQMMSRSKVNGA
jgi:hypothetical protein